MNDVDQCPICGENCYKEEYEYICSNEECLFSWGESEKKTLHPRRTESTKKFNKKKIEK